ncbi:amino acid adenylation domain-containing protein [Flavobacterium sp. F-65]|uniref:Amino acid adenylation domain-containing protein n=1 Tax=Flavobacterium pisciphilum TaxID=2893755 RepID=A0ABS8MP40_9FLAO|nr:non-ribosomal peptide synthetase [Flavobacterium sp. F-65]MCC9070538.1 amino acid adenylation domain-containing protein [Flavobacterium sp. F-65]
MKNEILHKLLSLGVQLKITDGNLKINAPKGVLTKELLEEIKEHKIYLMNLISSGSSIPNAEIKESYTLTPTQYFMWFTHEYLGGDRAYNITSTLKLKGKLNETLLEKAFQQVIARHESLRTIFRKNQKEEIQQYILRKEETEFKLQTVDLQQFSVEQLQNQIKEEYHKVFDLEKDLLLSATLLKSSEEEHILLFVLHHIIGDGWSLQLLTREVMFVYNALASVQAVELPELSIQYKDYSEWLNEKLISPEYIAKLQYWKQQFQTKSPALDLIQEKRPAIKTYNGRIHNHEFSKQFLDGLNVFAKEQQMTLFMLLMGGLNGLFSKYTGQTDITLGTTVAGREHADLEHQIGLYSNALPIRTQFEKEDSFLLLMQKQKQTLIKAYENKEYPFTALVNHLTLPKDQSRSALFDIMVLLQNHQGMEINDQKGINGVVASEYNEIERGVSQLDISFVFVEKEEGLSLSVEYNTDIYNKNFIVSLLNHFEGFIKSGLQKPSQSLNSIEILTLAEKNKILTEFNKPSISTQTSSTIIDLIKSAATENPNQTALIYQEEEISYALLEKYSNKLANYLKQQLHVEKGDFIGIELERNSWTIITILAVLKTGAVYIPIDPTYPEERKAYIKQDSNCKRTITNTILEEFRSASDRYIGEYITNITPTDLAYVIYTSGSTGNPKGVQITHASLVDYAVTFKDYFQLLSEDSIVQQASISFDTSIEEIFPILISGGTLVVYESKGDFETLFRLCERTNITVLSTNPYALQYLNGTHEQYNLKIRILISGGDVLQSDYISTIRDSISIYNTYGPTESTVCATYHLVAEKEIVIPIGKPIANRQVYIVEPEGNQLAPIGVMGELCISGKGLSVGYLNQPELTVEKFTNNPFVEGEKMYRTGDLAYWHFDGNIEYMGRIDHQVKIRGFRIELGEIETALLQYSTDLKQTVVAVKEINDEKVLVAYYVSTVEQDKSVIRTYLQGKLPEYMVPKFYIELENLPLTSNGKTDRKALPSLSGEDLIRKEYVSPQNATEQELANIWQEVLKVDRIGITDNFFELGGHSLIVVQVLNKIQKQLNKTIKFKDFFSNPTIEEISKKLSDSHLKSIEKAPELLSYPISSTQKQLWILSQFEGGTAAYNISIALKIKGDVDADKLEESFRLLIQRHEILRTNFKLNDKGAIEQFIQNMDLTDYKMERAEFLENNKDKSEVLDYINHKDHEFFDLQKAPLLKSCLIKTDTKEHIIFFSMHHIIGDGWSLEVIINDVMYFYNKLINQENIYNEALKIQFKDFVFWRNKQEEDYIKSQEYWLNQFEGEVPKLSIPSIKGRPLVKTFNGNKLSHQFSNEFLNELRAYAKSSDVTLFMVLLSGINILLYKYSNQDDIIIGTPLSGRNHPDTENLIGLFLNVIAIRTKLDTESTFYNLLESQKNNLLDAFKYQNYPLIDLIDQLNLPRDVTRSPLFDVMMSLNTENKIIDYNRIYAFEIERFETQKDAAQFDLNFVFNENDHLRLAIEYNTDLFEVFEIERIFQDFEKILKTALANPQIQLKEFLESKKEIKKRNTNRMSDFLKMQS